MSKNDSEGLILLQDVGESMTSKLGTTTYLQSCVDIIQMIVQRKMFQQTKNDEIGLFLFGTEGTANDLYDGKSDAYSHVTLAQKLSPVDWSLLEYVQNEINASNIQGDVLDGIVVAADHFHKVETLVKEKHIIVLTDFSSSLEAKDKLNELIASFRDDKIKVDVISPFGEDDNEDDESQDQEPRASSSANDTASSNGHHSRQKKPLTKSQKETRDLLKQICDESGGALFSFDEALSFLSTYQAKSIKSAGTKFTMTIGESLKLPIVTMIKCQESKPQMFTFKKVYAKDESVQIKTDHGRMTKDDEQRDVSDKTECVDAFRYGSSFVPIDDTDILKLKVEKCFSVFGFTKSKNVKRHTYLGKSINQIVPDQTAGENVEKCFVDMVNAMYEQDVYGIVRKVYSKASSPELGCLIPYISNKVTCLYYVKLPFDEDIRKFTLENFTFNKKVKQPTEEQYKIVDQLIDSMDLTKKVSDEAEEDDEEELYDPHSTFNPYIQRMFQSIAHRATNPMSDLPDFANHITNKHLEKIGEKVKCERTIKLLKRCAELFPTREDPKKAKKQDENIFHVPKQDDNEGNSPDVEITDENQTKVEENDANAANGDADVKNETNDDEEDMMNLI